MNNASEVAGDFLESRKKIFANATTNSIIDIIRMNEQLNDENLANHISFFKPHLNGLPARLAEIYSVYRLFSQEVGKLTQIVKLYC
jgi:hypothetical protein